jgi:hypothetical protein
MPKDPRAQLEILEQRRKVLVLYRLNLPYRRIAKITKYSVWSVGQIVRGALAEARKNSLAEHLDEQFARYEELYHTIESKIAGGEPLGKDDINGAIKILDARSRLLGLEAPKRTERSDTYTLMEHRRPDVG